MTDYKVQIADMLTDAEAMLVVLADQYQRDETVLFIRKCKALLSQDSVSDDDMAVLLAHY